MTPSTTRPVRRQKTWVLGSETFPISSVLLPVHVTGAPSPTAPPSKVIPSPLPLSSSPIVPPPVRLRSTPDTVPSSGPAGYDLQVSDLPTVYDQDQDVQQCGTLEPTTPVDDGMDSRQTASTREEAVGARAGRKARMSPAVCTLTCPDFCSQCLSTTPFLPPRLSATATTKQLRAI